MTISTDSFRTLGIVSQVKIAGCKLITFIKSSIYHTKYLYYFPLCRKNQLNFVAFQQSPALQSRCHSANQVHFQLEKVIISDQNFNRKIDVAACNLLKYCSAHFNLAEISLLGQPYLLQNLKSSMIYKMCISVQTARECTADYIWRQLRFDSVLFSISRAYFGRNNFFILS